jgi:transcriptional regulator with XRE-family HTH domain
MVTLRNVESMNEFTKSDVYSASLGARLRTIRQQQGLSLQAVELRSGGKWKAVVVGSYERGDRAITVAKLSELASFYSVPVSQLLPEGSVRSQSGRGIRKIVIDLEVMGQLPAETIAPLVRFVATIQDKRGDYNGRVLTVRASDLETLALLFQTSVDEVVDRLTNWSVIHLAN